MIRAVPLLLSLVSLPAIGQNAAHICVRDSQQRAIPGATVRLGSAPLGTTGADGCVTVVIAAPSGETISIEAPGFAPTSAQVSSNGEIALTLQPASQRETVVVTASRIPLALDSSASSVVSFTEDQLASTPGFTLDDQLRQVAGFQLYRRSSSWAANPTSQGVSLRGLGSSAPSRTLVLSDQVPLLDPFTASVHWNEIPALATESVEVMRGGASDLYGSSAIGGVIQVIPVTPSEDNYAIDAYGGGLDTYAIDSLGTATRGRWSALAA
jgi:outer membrane receptor protein involved in Fe transport